MISVRQCLSCGEELPGNAFFCTQCGQALTDSPNDATQQLIALTSLRSPAHPRIARFYHKVLSVLPTPVLYLIVAILSRSQDAVSERPRIDTEEPQKVIAFDAIYLRWFPLLTLIDAIGVASVAYAYTTARYGATNVDIFFWLGILLIFVPSTIRLISPTASRAERICLLCAAAICFYVVNIMFSPFSFAGYDEFLHWRTAEDIARSGHLFSFNTLLPASPFYPGLEIVTNALSTLTGLNTFYAGITVVGVAHLVMFLSLFILYERITQSSRIAGIATLLYMTNPHFLFFDSSYSYESLALPLATFVLFTLVDREKLYGKHRWVTLTTWLALSAVLVTHHMTDFVLDGLLLLWAATDIVQRPSHRPRSYLIGIALFGVLASLAWINLKGNPVVSYLADYFRSALDELSLILTHPASARPLFVSYAGQTAPLWERLFAIAAVALISLGLPFGLLCLWLRYRQQALACVFGIAALFYPLTQVFRFTNFGSEITDRAAAFLFIPISCILAIFIVQFWPVRRLNRKQISFISAALTVLFLGGVILGAGPPWELLPGPYLVGADARSIEPEGIQAAKWAYAYLGANNYITTDRTNRVLMSTYGDQRIVTYLEDGIDVTPVFFSSTFTSADVALLREAKVRYIVVDLRLSTSLPSLGFYFEAGEPSSFERTTPIARSALLKFDAVPQIKRIFDSGNIVIYDVGGLSSAFQEP